MPPKPSWQALSADRKQRQLDSIPPEWIIHVPPAHDHNSNVYTRQSVMHVPETCGSLSPLDVEITNTIDIDILLGNMATARWSAVQVTTAFCKRAIIAHQLVLSCILFHSAAFLTLVCALSLTTNHNVTASTMPTAPYASYALLSQLRNHETSKHPSTELRRGFSVIHHSRHTIHGFLWTDERQTV